MYKKRDNLVEALCNLIIEKMDKKVEVKRWRGISDEIVILYDDGSVEIDGMLASMRDIEGALTASDQLSLTYARQDLEY